MWVEEARVGESRLHGDEFTREESERWTVTDRHRRRDIHDWHTQRVGRGATLAVGDPRMNELLLGRSRAVTVTLFVVVAGP